MGCHFLHFRTVWRETPNRVPSKWWHFSITVVPTDQIPSRQNELVLTGDLILQVNAHRLTEGSGEGEWKVLSSRLIRFHASHPEEASKISWIQKGTACLRRHSKISRCAHVRSFSNAFREKHVLRSVPKTFLEAIFRLLHCPPEGSFRKWAF